MTKGATTSHVDIATGGRSPRPSPTRVDELDIKAGGEVTAAVKAALVRWRAQWQQGRGGSYTIRHARVDEAK